MNIKQVNRIFLLMAFIAVLINGLPETLFAESDMVKGEYSGWRLDEIVSDLARKTGLNIVGNFGDRKAAAFNLKGDVFYQEALSILARTNGMQIRKSGDLWVFLPENALPEKQSETGISKTFEYKSVESIRGAFADADKKGVNIWFPPAINNVVFVGDKRMIDEYKKLYETIDCPDWTMKCNYSLVDETGRTVATCVFNTLNKSSFRLIYEAASGADFEIKGRIICNDDADIICEESLKIKTAADDCVLSTTNKQIVKEKQAAEQIISFGDQKFTLKKIFTIQNNSRSFVMPDNEPALSDSFVAPREAENAASEKPDGFVVISGPQSPLLEKPLLLKNVALPEILEKLAAEEKITLICDENIKGRVSAFCYGKRLDKDELIHAFVRLHGFYAFKNEDGYTITTKKGFDDLNLISENAYISPELKRLTSARAQRVLTEWLAGAGVTATISPVKGNRLSVLVNEPWLGAIKAVLAKWAIPAAEFRAGAVLKVNSQKLETTGKLSEQNPVKQSWKTNDINAQIMLEHQLGSFESGLRQFRYSVNAEKPGVGRWMLQSSTSVPADSGRSLFSASGCFKIDLSFTGNIETEKEEETILSPLSENSFDKAFDSQF